MLGTRTRDGRIIGADESTLLWRHPKLNRLTNKIIFQFRRTKPESERRTALVRRAVLWQEGPLQDRPQLHGLAHQQSQA